MAEADPPLIREEAKPWEKKLLLFDLGKKKKRQMLSLPAPWSRACSALCSEHWVPGPKAALSFQSVPVLVLSVLPVSTQEWLQPLGL